ELDLSYNKITRNGALALAAGHLGNLRRLDLRSNRIGNEAVTALRERYKERVFAGEDERPAVEGPLRREWNLRGVWLRRGKGGRRDSGWLLPALVGEEL